MASKISAYMIPSRYKMSNIPKLLRNPQLLIEEINRMSYHLYPKEINRNLNKIVNKRNYPDQFDVMSEDWDNLIILDGCRYDYFKENNTIDGDLSCIISQASHSTEFLEKTFVGRKFHDTVYITSNPHAPRYINDEVFYLMESVYNKSRNSKPREHYPEKVLQMALDVIEDNPNKKYIIHFMQPNVPFLGTTAVEIRKELYEEEGIIFTNMEPSDIPKDFDPKLEVGTLKEACEKGLIGEDKLRKAYEENVDIALEHAQKLLERIDGKTAITADHGEMLGEPLPPLNLDHYSHKRHLYVDELREVPWLIIDSDERREIFSEEPLTDDQLEGEIVEDRLKRLGYLDYVN